MRSFFMSASDMPLLSGGQGADSERSRFRDGDEIISLKHSMVPDYDSAACKMPVHAFGEIVMLLRERGWLAA